jgi:hypothetical protein
VSDTVSSAILDEQPIGFVQSYLVSDYPDYGALIGVGEGVAGVDLLIGEEELTGQGIGSEILRRFVDEVVFALPSTTSCVARPRPSERSVDPGLREGGLQRRQGVRRSQGWTDARARSA